MILKFSGNIVSFGPSSTVTVTAEEGPFRMRVFWGDGTNSGFIAADPDFGTLSATKSFLTGGVFTARIDADLGGGVTESDVFHIRLYGTAAAGQNVVGHATRIDLIAGSNFNDTLNGAGGNDALSGGLGNDSLIGGAGNDQAEGGLGNDTMLGGDGDDQLFDFSGGNDRVEAGAGDDYASGGTGNDLMLGGAGNDLLSGEIGNDILYGEADNDQLLVGAGNDIINGGSGDDSIIGGAGNDTIVAGVGRDTVVGGPGSDAITLGVDRVVDRLVFRNAGEFGDVITGFEAGTDKIYLAFLKSAAFLANANPVAGGPGAWLLYETDTGILSVDMLGAGGAAPVQIARFAGNPALAATDFLFAP